MMVVLYICEWELCTYENASHFTLLSESIESILLNMLKDKPTETESIL